MKHLSLLFLALQLTACNTDNDNDVTLPEVEPIIANARVLNNGTCGPDHYFIEMYNVDLDSISTSVAPPSFTYYNWPEEFRVEYLEVFVDYRNPTASEARACPTFGPQPHRFVAREVLLPTNN
ncbi:MAG: hypothetical protein WBA16_01895 [Nonlabens sp.]